MCAAAVLGGLPWEEIYGVYGWAHLRLYDVDFGGSWGMARYVDAKMQELDKMIWVMGGRPTATVDVEGRHWCDDVVDISSNVGVHAADRLRRDQRLWNMEG
jgi:hypothetical protein